MVDPIPESIPPPDDCWAGGWAGLMGAGGAGAGLAGPLENIPPEGLDGAADGLPPPLWLLGILKK